MSERGQVTVGTIGSFFAKVAPGVERATCYACEATTASFTREVYTNDCRLEFYVPDMVPPLRQWSLTITGSALVHRHAAAILLPLAGAVQTINAEREIRHWFACDP